MTKIMPLFVVWIALTLLLIATVLCSFVFTGLPSLAAGLAIAAAKAGLVFWYYIGLREETGLVRLSAIAAILWLLIFFLLVAPDYMMRPL